MIGRYRIERRLGSGGFAVVWLAHDDVLESPVAVKVLGENWSDQLDVRERFIEEARVLRRAESPRLVHVYDIGELPDGRPYFVMTYAEGGTLKKRLDSGPLSLIEALDLAVEIALAAADLHDSGVIHRDIKPSNVLFHEGRVRLADLGLAKDLATASGFTLAAGSPGYMAPEQAGFGGDLDARADVHGIGAVLYHMLTGERPAAADQRTPPSRFSLDVPEAVDDVVLRSLDPDPGGRWESAREFASAIMNLRATLPEVTGSLPRIAQPVSPQENGGPAPATPEPTTEAAAGRPVRRRGRKKALIATALAAVAVAGVAGGAWYAINSSKDGPVTIEDVSGRLSLQVPADWAGQVRNAEWDPRRKAGLDDDVRRPALEVAPDLRAAQSPNSGQPRVFAGVTSDTTRKKLPSARGRDWLRRHGCEVTRKMETGTIGEWSSRVRQWTCTGTTVTDAGLRKGAEAVYVIIQQPAGGPDQAAGILESIRTQ